MKIERSNQPGKFNITEIRAAVAETKRRKAQPGYAERELREKRAAEAQGKAKGTRFPDLARRGGTKPVMTGGMSGGAARTQHCKNILARVEKNAPKL